MQTKSLQRISVLAAVLFLGANCPGQDAYLKADAAAEELVYTGDVVHEVVSLAAVEENRSPRNLIFLIADGMSFAHLEAARVANRGDLHLTRMPHTGLVRTGSLGKFMTDSAAAGTALASGLKARGGVLGLDPEGEPVDSILHQAEAEGLATGLVATSAITHATPAAFIAHEPSRNNYEAIAADFLDTEIDVFIGGGQDHFAEREDGRNLLEALKVEGYEVVLDREALEEVEAGKLAALLAPIHIAPASERGDMLEKATTTALRLLSANPEGFFLMIEGSQVDWGGHAGSTVRVVEEMLDFDRALGLVLAYAALDGETLVVVTSDHETGGMAILEGDETSGRVKAAFSTGGHTGLMVPVFAYGPGAGAFTGYMDNTELNRRLRAALFEGP